MIFRWYKLRWALLLSLTAAAQMGCNKPGGTSGPTQLAPRKNAYIADVPVPTDFVLDEGKSKSRVYPNIRIVEHVYYGSGTAQGVRNFFVTQMPGQQWQLLAETLFEAEFILRYTKGGEFCEVRIKQGGTGNWLKPISIKVLIEPHQESGAKAP